MHMGTKLTGIGGLGLGAALMYVFDPNRGVRRRKLLRDRAGHLRRAAVERLNAAAYDLRNRAQGLAATVRSRLHSDVAHDRVIEARIRAELGRVVSHPSAIAVAAEDGWVTLSGQVPAREAEALRSRVLRVRGVSGVDDRLDVHEAVGQSQ